MCGVVPCSEQHCMWIYLCTWYIPIYIFLEMVMKGRTVFSHTDVPVKSLFIENRIYKKKIKILNGIVKICQHLQ